MVGGGEGGGNGQRVALRALGGVPKAESRKPQGPCRQSLLLLPLCVFRGTHVSGTPVGREAAICPNTLHVILWHWVALDFTYSGDGQLWD